MHRAAVPQRNRHFRRLARPSGAVQSHWVNTQDLEEIQRTLASVHDTVGALTFPRCDQDDLFEVMQRIGDELHAAHPSAHIIGTFLNSIARSLRNQPEAREICVQLEETLQRTGLPSTWQSGI